MAAIYDATTGDVICAGLQGCNVCDEAIRTARSLASDLGEPVHLVDDDGEWLVPAEGGCTPVEEG